MSITRILSGVCMLLLFGASWVTLRLTVMNPAWVVRRKYPAARCYINKIDSGRTGFWAEIGDLAGIPVTAPFRYLNVEIDHYAGDLTLDDFTEVCELHVSHSRVVDISAYYRYPGQLTCPVFTNCDFSALPDSQMRLLAPYRPNPEYPDAYQGTFWIPFESRSFQSAGQPELPSHAPKR